METLISTALLFLMLGLTLSAYQFFVSQAGRDDHRFARQFERLRAHWDLHKVISHTRHAVVRRPDQQGLGLYFLGREKGLTAVTVHPLLGSGDTAVFRLFLEPATNPVGSVLVYEEAVLQAPLIHADQQLDFSQRAELVFLPADTHFQYLINKPHEYANATCENSADGLELASQPSSLRIVSADQQMQWPMPAGGSDRISAAISE